MNKNERRYLEEVLLRDPDVYRVWHHFLKIRIAANQHYETDFLVQLRCGRLEIHETKVQWSISYKSGKDAGKEKKIRV